MSKKIVLVLTMKPHHGGKYQYTLSLIKALANKKIIVLSSLGEWGSILPEKFIFKQIKNDNILLKLFKKFLRFSYVGLRIIRKYGHNLFSLNRNLKNINPDYVIFPGGDNMSYESIYPSITPVFDIMHKYEEFPEISNFFTLRLRNFHYKNVLKYCSIILVDSDLGRKQLIECYDRSSQYLKKIFKLYYTYPSYINQFKKKKQALYNYKYVFYPAQFWEHKNHINLLKAIEILNNKSNFNIKLILVGSKKNNYKNVLQEIIKLNIKENVNVLDYVNNEDLVNLYENAYCCVMPSYLGPTNIPQLEAIALDCPVIVSDVYASREQMMNAALYINPKDPNDIAKKILSLKNISLRNELINNGRKLMPKRDNDQFKNTLIKIIYG